jgi:CubicO group peptidase (beta-lactamase class C family)
MFRIFSMTKPVATVAAMLLAEEGKIDVMAPCRSICPSLRM